MKYEKYYTIIVLFSIFIILYFINVDQHIENFEVAPELRMVNVNGQDIRVKCYDEKDKDKKTQYTLYQYNKMPKDLLKMMENLPSSSKETQPIQPCMRVALKHHQNEDNLKNGDPNDYKYALTMDNLGRLSACEFKDDVNPVNKTQCEKEGFLSYIDNEYDIVNILYHALYVMLLLIIIVEFKRKIR